MQMMHEKPKNLKTICDLMIPGSNESNPSVGNILWDLPWDCESCGRGTFSREEQFS